MDFFQLEKILQDCPPFRVRQAKEAVFKNLISDWSEATNLGKDLQERLTRVSPLGLEGKTEVSEDKKTVKAVLFLKDGEKVETVLMRHKQRNTVCVSTQVGCSLACDFCLTGRSGWVRDLEAGEIVAQILFLARFLKLKKERVSNVVFMGMGEPFLNYSETIKAVRMINQEMGIGSRKISISTVGIVEGIKNLIKEPEQVNLAVSLHAPDSSLRSQLMPINEKYPLEKLLAAVKSYIEKTNRKVMIEYLMLKSINDSPERAEQLAKLLTSQLPPLFVVNLISYNSTRRYQASSLEKILRFRKVLERYNLEVVQRYKFGRDIKGACGQLTKK